ncbi:MAG TPA: hypothetical protein VHU44_15480 [Acidobacteriaceae bacterium]|jgi:hypothetical protein|nr:hypothetical protein [Acidobacteriaceae bacterium]
MSSSRKKVLVRRFSGDALPGYLPNAGIVHAGAVELLDLSGRILPLPLNDVKHISFVRDFNLSDTQNPERLTRRTFLARPRTEGLWVRFTFRSGDQFEGLAPTDISLLDNVIDDTGLFIIPPDTRSNTQRLFIPRTAISELQLVAVITTPSKKQPVAGRQSKDALQDELFHLPLDPDSRPN